MQSNKKRYYLNIVLIFFVIALAVVPFFIAKDGEFGGTDDMAQEAITEINPDYKPWFSPILEPKSAEVESLLFSLQAAIGAGVIGYGLGYFKGRSKSGDKQN